MKHRTIIILEHDTPHPEVRFGPDVTRHVANVLHERDLENIEARIIAPMLGALARAPAKS